MYHTIIIICLAAILPLGPAQAQTPTCDKLTSQDKILAQEILDTQHPYDCCDRTISQCLEQKPTCALVWRLAENICRRISNNEDRAKITRGLSRRAHSMLPVIKKAKIDLADTPAAGQQDAPVTLVVYACPRCPFCAEITPQLYAAITKGALKGKARLFFKTFPIRNHEYSKESGLGFMAAAKLDRFWEFLLYSYKHFDSFNTKQQAAWAKEVGIDQQAFSEMLSNPDLRNQLVSFKKEGIINKVDATPTFFINGRKYIGDIKFSEIIDVVEEEYERVTNIEYRNEN
jgi:protein-disulfide isomerase